MGISRQPLKEVPDERNGLIEVCSTTEAGERLRQSLAPRIAEIESDIAALTAYRDKPSRTVHLTLSDHALD